MQDAFSLGKARELEAAQSSLLDDYASRAARGDRAAFEALYTATIDEVFGYLMGQLRDDETAEDLAANIYLKAWASARSYRSGSNKYRRWLFAIAHNELRDHWRRNRPRVELTEALAARLVQPSGDQDLQRSAESALAAMDSLNDQQRQIVSLRFFSELPHAEIAKILGKREGAVRAQLLRALRQMRKVIDDAAT